MVNCNANRAYAPAPRESKITVAVNQNGPLVVATPVSEFRLSRMGYLSATLVREGQKFTLDDVQADAEESADEVVSDGKPTHDFVLDLSKARVTNPSGRLGAIGKRIEVSGKSQSMPRLEKTLAIEVYDDLPGLALASTSYKDVGTSEISIGRV